MTTAEKLRAEGELKGRAEGELKGRAEVLLDLLAMKFPQVPAAIRETVRGASMPQLDLWTQRILSATTLAEIFG